MVGGSRRVVVWRDARELLVEGLGWPESERAHPYDRFPARAEPLVNEWVWHLSRCSAGVAVRFVTDSPSVRVRWRLLYEERSLPRFAASGHSGVDLYTRSDERWRHLGTGLPEAFPENEAILVEGLAPPTGDGGRRELLVHLPLFNGVERVEVGVEPGSVLDAARPSPALPRPVCFYGTSIVQGGCASRPGMAHVAQLRRRLDRPFLNLGLAGNGQTHAAVAPFLAELDAAVYVIDSLPNMDTALVEAWTEPFLETLASARPAVPILVVGSITYAGSDLQPQLARRLREAAAAQEAIVERLRAAGMEQVFSVAGATLLGDDDEATVDTVHPSDLGFRRLADAFEVVLADHLDD